MLMTCIATMYLHKLEVVATYVATKARATDISVSQLT